jgi:putative transcriptional regulator
MQVATGSIIISTPALEGSIFEQSVILITEKNVHGAVGFIINKLYPKVLNDLTEFSNSKPFPLYAGGPVEQESLFFVHNQPKLMNDSICINDTLYFGGNFKQAVQLINNGSIGIHDIQLFIGYCGWDAAELEAEIEEGSWMVTNALVEQIFATTHTINWQLLYSTSIKK